MTAEEAGVGPAVHRLGLTPIGQTRSVTALLRHTGYGSLASDLAAPVASEG